MKQQSGLNYRKALEDFYTARNKAAIESVVSRLTGSSNELLCYDEVRTRLQVTESAERKLTEIPLDAIVGSVSRHSDFTRSLLPLKKNDMERWARVKSMTEEPSGLPPIEVYQVGEVYFIIDGHHRASVAREMGATHIEAYVHPVFSRVVLKPEDNLDDILLKAEFTDFLRQTHLDQLRPQAAMSGSLPGEYHYLLEQISAHHYLRTLKEKREISSDEAVTSWYDQVYSPVVEVIRTRNILRRFSDRTETDLFYYIMSYRERSEQELGWRVTPRDAAENLTFNYARDFRHRLARFRKNVNRWLMPEPLEPALPPGFWRQQRKTAAENERGLFDTILVALPGTESSWNALDAALFVAHNESASINGLHIVSIEEHKTAPYIEPIQRRFMERCTQAGIDASMAVETGHIPRVIYERSFWVDLVVIPLSFPPPNQFFKRLGSGIRSLIRRSATPLLIVPPNAPVGIHSALVAYGGGRMSDEALTMAAYLCLRFTMNLSVLVTQENSNDRAALLQHAHTYLEGMGIRIVTYLEEQGDPARAILNRCQTTRSDLILMGGYESGLIKEIFSGSTVDRVLRGTNRMVMICR